MFVRLIVVCMDTWKNGRAAVNQIHLSKTAFKNEPKHAFKNEPKHAFKNDHLPEKHWAKVDSWIRGTKISTRKHSTWRGLRRMEPHVECGLMSFRQEGWFLLFKRTAKS